MDTAKLVVQLDEIIDSFLKFKRTSRHPDLSDLPKHERQGLVTRALAAISRITGNNSSYMIDAERILKQLPALHLHTSSIIGIVQALRDDLNAGYIQSVSEIIHAKVFSDFIEMAEHLVTNGYKDAAAVIAGSTLESHLKKLATKNSLPIELNAKPIKAEQLNQDLGKAKVYLMTDQKSITAWLDLRNNAAHGKYAEYSIEQVKLLIIGIQSFISRNPA